MTNYFVSSADGDDTDNGTTMDDGTGGGVGAWATLEHALEAGGLSAGDYVWVRPNHSEIPTSDIDTAYDGADDNPLSIIGWPKAAIPNTTITEADFTNGSRVVDNVVGITPSREGHTARYITGPDGEQYTLTSVLWEASLDGIEDGVSDFTVGSKLTNTTQTKYGKVWAYTDDGGTAGTLQYTRDSATAWVENNNLTDAATGDGEIDAGGETAVGFLIDRDYAGTTVTGVDGKFQIEADEDYATAQAIDDSAWTIKKTAWDANNPSLPVIDFNDGAFNIDVNTDDFHIFRNLEFKDTTDVNGLIGLRASSWLLMGCLFKQTAANAPLLGVAGSRATYRVIRCIFEGSGAGNVQHGVSATNYGVEIYMRDSAIFNVGRYALLDALSGTLKNVNIGTDIPNNDTEIAAPMSGGLLCLDCKLGGENGYFQSLANLVTHAKIQFENFQQILGNHKTYFTGGEYLSTAVSGETPDKKLSDIVLKITPNVNNFEFSEEEQQVRIPLGEINADAGSQTFKFWLYNDTGVTLNDTTATDDIYLQAEYVKSYDDTTEYTMATATSAEIDILDAASASDWDYLQVTIVPAVESKVRLWLRISKYEANDIFIDPQVVIT